MPKPEVRRGDHPLFSKHRFAATPQSTIPVGHDDSLTGIVVSYGNNIRFWCGAKLRYRIVAMLTRMAMKFDGVAESGAGYFAEIDCDYEHRSAEHEHDDADKPAPVSL
ncbi:MAG: hypothetical protein ACF788_12550 [Novipirellula sp. JB048]